jgi:hypothetical protein
MTMGVSEQPTSVNKVWDGGLYVCAGCRLADGHKEDCPAERARALWMHQRDLDASILKRHDKKTNELKARVDAMDEDDPKYAREHDRLIKMVNQGTALSERLRNHDEKELERMTNDEIKKDAAVAQQKDKRTAAKAANGDAPKAPRGVTVKDEVVDKAVAQSTKDGAVDTDKLIANLRSHGLGFQRIADMLKIPTKRGGTWTSTTVKNVVDRLAKPAKPVAAAAKKAPAKKKTATARKTQGAKK